MSYAEAKARYAAIGVDTEAAMARLKTVPISLHCWQEMCIRDSYNIHGCSFQRRTNSA